VYRHHAPVSPPPGPDQRREPTTALDPGRTTGQADRRARPRRRRAFKMAWPARVAMRWRNPCRLARFRLLGW
jgi:hypothetical protein